MSAVGSRFSAGPGRGGSSKDAPRAPGAPASASALSVAFRVEPPASVCPSLRLSICVYGVPVGAKLCAKSQVPWPCGCALASCSALSPALACEPPAGPRSWVHLTVSNTSSAPDALWPGLSCVRPWSPSPGPPVRPQAGPQRRLGQQGPRPVGSGETGGLCGRPAGRRRAGRGSGGLVQSRRRDGVLHAGRPPHAQRPGRPVLLATPRGRPPAGRAAPSSLSSPGRPSWPGGRAGVSLSSRSSSHMSRAPPVIDEAWKLVPEFN